MSAEECSGQGLGNIASCAGLAKAAYRRGGNDRNAHQRCCSGEAEHGVARKLLHAFLQVLPLRQRLVGPRCRRALLVMQAICRMARSCPNATDQEAHSCQIASDET
jgi:hypothetical protein